MTLDPFSTILAFSAVTTLVLLFSLIVRDLVSGKRKDADGDDRLPALYVPPEKAGRTALDRWFYNLLETSGSSMDRTTAALIPAAGALLGAAIPVVLFDNILLGVAGTLLGVLLPVGWWQVRSWRRQAAMRKHLPEALDFMADAVRAGLSLEKGMELVGREARPPIRDEFRMCASQLAMGYPPYTVLQRASRRIPIPEFRIFATAVLVHRKSGGDLALLAQRLAQAARDRAEFRGHMKAVTAGSRLSVIGLTVGTLIACAVLTYTRPEYLQQFLANPSGPSLLAAAAGLQVLGLLWVWRILQVKY
ncbi:type II secretion system F family protein [Thermopirellula anaerolimosa]